jgi:pseudomonalisin
MMPNQVRTCSIVVAFLLMSGLSTSVVAQTPANRVAAEIDENQVTTLLGNVHPMARAEFDRGAVSAETPLDHLIFQLQPSQAQQAALDELVEAQHDPQSPLFHHWLTPAEYGARFGASLQDLARITIWLTEHGFVVDEITAGNRQVIFSGNAGQVEDTFHTQIHRYVVDGVSHIANTQDPQVPSALAAVVVGIASLHDFRHESQMRSRTALSARPQYSAGSTHYLYPADWATIYDVNPVYKAGTTGAGSSIAIVGRSNINLADVSEFRAKSGLQANNPTVILVNTNPGLVAGDQDESTLDVEWSGAVAPAATLKFVVAASTATTDGIDLSALYIVNHLTTHVMSTSYGNCEQDMGSTELALYSGLWQQAASEGISSFVSSGDAGAAGCYGGSSTSASGTGVNGLCSSPYSTCVGGTEFHESSNPGYWSSTNGVGDVSALSYIPEEVWNESGTNGGAGLWASGGGASLHYTQPAWQKGLSGVGAANGMRAVPDVAMSASAHDGYIIVENGTYWVISGTSAASPSFAGIMALVVQARSGVGQGNANPSLYALSNASRSPFHATPMGNNSVPGQTGFTASGAQYNLATGLGSVDAAALAAAWGGGGSKTAIDFALAASAGGATVLAGKSTTFTLRVTESGAGTNRVSLKAAAPSGVTGSISPNSILPGSTATVTVTAASATTAGLRDVVITGTDSTGTQSATYALTVTQSPTLALNAGSTLVSVMRGGSTTTGFSTATGGSFTGNISYSVSGLPAGVTAKWSANPQTPPASVSSNSETLTLTASAGAPVSSVAFVVTAAGDGLSASKSSTLQVQPAVGAVLTVLPQAISMPSGSAVVTTVAFTPVDGAVVATAGKGSSISMSGLPKGVTASWSSAGVNSTGAVVWKLTLKASANAVASRSAPSLNAAFTAKNGSVYRSTINVPLTVTLNAAKRPLPRPVQVQGQS